MTQLELEEQIAKRVERVTDSQSLVMIQCVGCRQEDRNYCARICCSHSIKNALKLKEINPQMEIYILFRDMRTYGSIGRISCILWKSAFAISDNYDLCKLSDSH